VKIHIFFKIQEARTVGQRLIGLMGFCHWPSRYNGLFFPSCRSVHTWFTFVSLDLIFFDNDGRVIKVYEKTKPWSMFWTLNAKHCLEVPAGLVLRKKIKIGDKIRLNTI
jgi:uncharacterized membrane protein (UPF0127 family)